MNLLGVNVWYDSSDECSINPNQTTKLLRVLFRGYFYSWFVEFGFIIFFFIVGFWPAFAFMQLYFTFSISFQFSVFFVHFCSFSSKIHTLLAVFSPPIWYECIAINFSRSVPSQFFFSYSVLCHTHTHIQLSISLQNSPSFSRRFVSSIKWFSILPICRPRNCLSPSLCSFSFFLSLELFEHFRERAKG